MKTFVSAVLVLSLGICINAQELTCQNGGEPTPDGTRCECLQGFKGEACEERTIEFCKMMPETGPCKALFPRFYYDSETETCESFNYGGCQGNANNFETVEDCEIEAAGICTYDDFCSLPPDEGPCEALFTRFYHDEQDGLCKEFNYGGCDGNKNNFETKGECESMVMITCLPKAVGAVCGLLPETGQCKGNFLRYYFDITSQTCKTFVYGGCDANANNFETEEECMSKTEVCKIIQTAGSGGMAATLLLVVSNLMIHMM